MVCVDFSNTFVQANLKEKVWIHIPCSFTSTNTTNPMCLLLCKSLYGLLVAPWLWYEKLHQAQINDGFSPSQHDNCMFLKTDMLIFLWVDSCGIITPSTKIIDDFIARLKTVGFALTKDSDFADCLVITFRHDTAKGMIKMPQQGLIKKILLATNLQDCNLNWTPAAQACLHSDPDEQPMQESWNYQSIIGMLLYLSTNTCPLHCLCCESSGTLFHHS